MRRYHQQGAGLIISIQGSDNIFGGNKNYLQIGKSY